MISLFKCLSVYYAQVLLIISFVTVKFMLSIISRVKAYKLCFFLIPCSHFWELFNFISDITLIICTNLYNV